MKVPVALLAWLLTAMTVTSCFKPDYVCSYCSSKQCAGQGLVCRADNRCVPENEIDRVCQAMDAAVEVADISAGVPADALSEAPIDATPDESSDGEAGIADDGGNDTEAAPPTLLCADQCCVGGKCLTSPQNLKQGLLLWADRTSLEQMVGVATSIWADRSGQGHHITVPEMNTPPTVQSDPVGRVIKIEDPTTMMQTPSGPEFSLDLEDFTILVLASCNSDIRAGVLTNHMTTEHPPTGIRLFCNYSGVFGADLNAEGWNHAALYVPDEIRGFSYAESLIISKRAGLADRLHLYVARRTGGVEMQLRVDGMIEGRLAISPSLSLANDAAFSVGSWLPLVSNPFRGNLAAFILVKGPLTDQELEQLENFLLTTEGPDASPL